MRPMTRSGHRTWAGADCGRVATTQPHGPINNNVVLVASTKIPEGFRMVLETRCDADDAVATDFVELIQSSAAAAASAIAADSGKRQHHHGGSTS
jgi:hypothetical protein